MCERRTSPGFLARPSPCCGTAVITDVHTLTPTHALAHTQLKTALEDLERKHAATGDVDGSDVQVLCGWWGVRQTSERSCVSVSGVLISVFLPAYLCPGAQLVGRRAIGLACGEVKPVACRASSTCDSKKDNGHSQRRNAHGICRRVVRSVPRQSQFEEASMASAREALTRSRAHLPSLPALSPHHPPGISSLSYPSPVGTTGTCSRVHQGW